MNSKQAKKLRKEVRRKAAKSYLDFRDYVKKHGFKDRLRLVIKILFNTMPEE